MSETTKEANKAIRQHEIKLEALKEENRTTADSMIEREGVISSLKKEIGVYNEHCRGL